MVLIQAGALGKEMSERSLKISKFIKEKSGWGVILSGMSKKFIKFKSFINVFLFEKPMSNRFSPDPDRD